MFVILPSLSMGTLKSTLIKTRLSATSRSTGLGEVQEFEKSKISMSYERYDQIYLLHYIVVVVCSTYLMRRLSAWHQGLRYSSC